MARWAGGCLWVLAVGTGDYAGEARKDIARRFGRLLSYPDSTIEEKIRSNTAKR